MGRGGGAPVSGKGGFRSWLLCYNSTDSVNQHQRSAHLGILQNEVKGVDVRSAAQETNVEHRGKLDPDSHPLRASRVRG